jgi:S-adenosylmethionine hydrolase
VLVGPDNGLLLPAATALGGALRAVELTSRAYFRHTVSSTFHGRDIFAPVAAHLARGLEFTKVGTAVPLDELIQLDDPVVRRGDGWLQAEVLTVDHFGNVQLAAGQDELAALGHRLWVRDVEALVGTTFGSVPPGKLVAYVDSSGHLALAVNGGSAADLLDTAPGAVLHLRR